ncbi:hypothetical protein GGD67_002915 [Bradyrhizobium sp. IAR9]|nr:hypothetical protein [Bradyrhizobium sp. IAR9]
MQLLDLSLAIASASRPTPASKARPAFSSSCVFLA